MRIIAGKYKGHRLVAFEAAHIRPTTDRVKESLFNKLMGQWEGARVLDLFSGTGNLGLEALSWGAASVDFVENHRKSLRILNENLAKLKVTDGFKIHSFDVFQFLKRYDGPPFDIVLADPPFTQKLADQVLRVLCESLSIREGTTVAIESSRQESVENGYQRLNRLDQKNFGDKHLNLYEAF